MGWNSRHWLNWLRTLPTKDPLEKAHAPAIQVMLIVLGVGLTIYQVVSMLPSPNPRPVSVLNWFMIVIFALSFWQIRRGSLQNGVRVLLSVFVVFMGIAYSQTGLIFQLPNLLSQAALLVLGALVLSRRDFWLLSAAFIGVFALGAWVDHGRLGFGFRPFLSGSLSLVVIALLLDSLGQNLRRLLVLSLEREHALQASEASLKAEIVAREQAQAMLLTAQKNEALGILSLAITHDFHHALAGIAKAARLAMAGPVGDSENHWRTVSMQVNHVEQILQGLIHVVRNNRGEVSEFDAVASLRTLAPLLHHVAGRRARLDVKINAASALLTMDRGLFDMVLVNLVSNAHDAVTAGGTIEVSLDVVGAEITIRVRDNGPGMDAETLAKSVEPFFTTKAKGNGLGLPIAKRVVETAGGQFNIEAAPGRGCLVSLSFPLHCAPPVRAQSSDAGLALVVDDDPDMAQIAEVYLRAAGFQVRCVESGEAMLAALRSQTFAVALVDERMPGMSGSEAIKHALAETVLPATVHMSADCLSPALSDTFKVAGVVHLAKPFTGDALLRAIHAARSRETAPSA